MSKLIARKVEDLNDDELRQIVRGLKGTLETPNLSGADVVEELNILLGSFGVEVRDWSEIGDNAGR